MKYRDSAPLNCSRVKTGQRFGKLVVLDRQSRSKHGILHILCKCDCGRRKFRPEFLVRTGGLVSCGCWRSKRHGMTHTQVHKIWSGMISRCICKTHPSYPRYGAKGIVICERWLRFENFFEDMGHPPRGLTIERNDSKGNYEPGNCRWATYTEQARNISTNHRVTFNGKTLCLAEWEEITGFLASTIRQRLKARWTPGDALMLPLRSRPRNRVA